MNESLHLLQNLVDFWHDILAVEHDGGVGAVPQSHVENGAVLHSKQPGDDVTKTLSVSHTAS